MDAVVVVGFFFMTLLVFVALIAKLALFCRAFSEDTRCICRRMDCADSYEEYCRWRDELCCHYLMLIPFVNEKNVMRLYDRIFYKKDSANTQVRKDGLVPLLLPSVLGMCLCVICLCGMTWAWFTASVKAPPQTLTSAHYWVEVKVEKTGQEDVETDGQEDGQVPPLVNINSYYLDADTTYTVTLTAKGNGYGGYCVIEHSDSGWRQYIQILNPEKTIIIPLFTELDGVYTFTGVWGDIPSDVPDYEILQAEPEDAEDADETTPEPIDSSDPTEYETTPEDTEISEPESTEPQETTPAEGDSTPVVPSDPIPSDTPVTDPA